MPLDNQRLPQFHVVGRLPSDVTTGSVRSELAIINGRLSAAYPQMPIAATPLADTVAGNVRPTLLLLLAESRRTEMVVRLVLGATGGQL